MLREYLLLLDLQVLVPYCSSHTPAGVVPIISKIIVPLLRQAQVGGDALPLPLTFAVLVLLPSLLSAVESLKPLVASSLNEVIESYLMFTSMRDSETVTQSLEQMVQCFSQEVQPHLLPIVQSLVNQWEKNSASTNSSTLEKVAEVRSILLRSINNILKAMQAIPSADAESVSVLLIHRIGCQLFAAADTESYESLLISLNLIMYKSKSCPPSVESFFPVVSACLGPNQTQSVQLGIHMLPVHHWIKDPLSLESVE